MNTKKKIIQPRTLPGFIDLLPEDQILFNNLVKIISSTYESFGFVPLDTPVMELSEIILSKSGGETEKQVYSLTKGKNDLTMRFDLTVPLAKYVAKNYNNLKFPHKRYQIGKVYRGESKQRGRFREFYQCDIDIIGNDSLHILNDAELVQVIFTVFSKLGFDNFTIKISNRKLMKGYLNHLELSAKSAEIMVIIDKFHKIGLENTKQLLLDLNLTVDNVEKIIKLISLNGAADDIVNSLTNLNINESAFIEGLLELREVTNCIKNFGVPDKNFEIDLTIIRGLDYYTGTVYETFLNDYKDIGSVCSGGRYEDLAGLYTQQKLPGVGVSIGLSRLFYQLTEAKFLKPETSTTTQVLIVPFDYNLEYVIKVANLLRENNINTEIYYEDKKLKQKLNYANSHGIPYVIIIGEDEIKNSTVTLKNMNLGTQEVVPFLDVPSCINK